MVVSSTSPYMLKCSRSSCSVTTVPVCEANLTKIVAAEFRAEFSDFTGWFLFAAHRILQKINARVQD